MSLNVTFRVVGVYCYFENLTVEGVDANSTVAEVMAAVRRERPAFNFFAGTSPISGNEIVDTIEYDYSNDSMRPPNTSAPPADGFRDLSNQLGGSGPSLIWQYYRSVTGSIGGTGDPYEIKLITPGQPSFATTAISQDLSVPSNFDIGAFNLTWRILQLQLDPERQAAFQAAKLEAMQKRLG